MDFVSDASLTADPSAVSPWSTISRECPAIEVAHWLPGWRVIHVLERVAAERGLPKSIVCDNGPEFAGKAMDRWAYEHGVTLQFIRPGKPVENAYCESFNSKLRDECLNANWFAILTDAQHARTVVAGVQRRAAPLELGPSNPDGVYQNPEGQTPFNCPATHGLTGPALGTTSSSAPARKT